MDKILQELADIKKLLMGNGEVGVAEMARRSFEYIQNQKVVKNGLLDWSFRVCILLILSFVAVRVGLQ